MARKTKSAATPLFQGKRRLFRWTAALVVPVIIALVLELTLWLAGWGYPTHFFLPLDSSTAGVYTENPKFGWSFFPPRLARAPDPIRLSQVKPPGTYRLFVFGESAALGDPEPAYGFSRILRELLEARCPGTRFEVVNVAMTAISSHAVLSIAQDCVRFQGDLWIIYMGNNEVIGPFGHGSVFGARAPPMPLIRANLAIMRTRLGQLLDQLWQRWRVQAQGVRQWEGMKMMLNERIRASDPAIKRVYHHFSRNLREVLSTASRARAKSIVCSVASNLKDCPPFLSLHRPDLTEAGKAEWTRLFEAATVLESSSQFEQALALYRQAVKIDSTYAALAFRMGRCYVALGQAASAEEAFTQARNLDTLRFRADTSIDGIIRDQAARRAGPDVRFFDSTAALTNACALGIPGSECFWDHVHFNFAGNYRVARGLAEQALSLLPESVRRSSSRGQVLTEAECAERLALTDYDQRSVLERMWRRVHEPPFTAQLDHDHLLERWSGMLSDLNQRTDGDGLNRAITVYRQALERRPDDWMLRHRFGFILEVTGDLASAERQWQRVVDIVPRYADAWYKLGDMSARTARLTEAEAHYRQVLQLRPNSFEAMNGLGLVFMSKSRFDEAAEWFRRALQIEPAFAQARVNWGLLLSRRGNLTEAEAQFREALRCGPEESPGAHINLGNLLAAQQKHAEAIDHYRKAIQRQPNQASVHLSLANSIEAIGRGSEALAQYQEAIRLDPTLPEAHFNLGVALAKRGNLASAVRCFEEAVRLNPKDPQALLNLGVALAQQNRLREAVVQFQAVLRLEPTNAAASQYLRTANGRLRSSP